MGYGEELEALWRYNAKQRSNVAESQHDVNARQAPKDRKQAVLRRRFDSLLGDGYDPEFLAPLKAAAGLIDEQGAEILHLREQYVQRGDCMSYTTMTTDAYYQIDGRINDADRTYGCPSSAHEMLGVIAEEYAELIEALRSGKSGSVEWEALDLAAACIRLAYACNVGSATTTPALDAFAKRSGFLDARETQP